MSMKKMIIDKEKKIVYFRKARLNPNRLKSRINKIGVINSTSGYRQEILLPQFAHFPFRIRKLKIGKLCQGFIELLQVGQ